MKKRTALFLLLLLAVPLFQGCPDTPFETPSGPDAEGRCTGGPISVAVPLQVFCDVSRITATVTWQDEDGNMQSVTESISRDNPSAVINVPSGPDRVVVVEAFDEGGAVINSFSGTFCVPDGQPLLVAVDVQPTNRPPNVGITPDGGTVSPGERVVLTARASDPDKGCDRVSRYSWTSSCGTLQVQGGSAVWTTDRSCLAVSATVSVTARDERGGTRTATAGFAGFEAAVGPFLGYCTSYQCYTITASSPDRTLTYGASIVAQSCAATLTRTGPNTWDLIKNFPCTGADRVGVRITAADGGGGRAGSQDLSI